MPPIATTGISEDSTTLLINFNPTAGSAFALVGVGKMGPNPI